MSESPPDIPFVKFLTTDLIDATAPLHGPVRAYYEAVNMGTAPTTAHDQVWASAVLEMSIIHQSHVDLDNPPVEPNGGMHKGWVQFEGHYLAFPGDWELTITITNAAGERADHVRLPFTLIDNSP